MNKQIKLPLLILSALFVGLFTISATTKTLSKKVLLDNNEISDSAYVIENYDKYEYQIPMRDGVKLFTIVYIPKDKSQKYPMLMKRTPYSIRPYGEGKMPKSLGPSRYLMRDKYIFVYQDVRGRYMSEGLYDNMRPHIDNKKGKKQIDESSDTYDTIDWLLKKLDEDNGRVGQWGISYPGFYTIAGAVDAHPALKASSPQAPISDFFFDDFHHQGAYMQSYWLATSVFGYQKDSLTTESWYKMVYPETNDGYEFYMEMGPLKNADKYFGKDNFFWQQLKEHPNYDEFWQKRSILPHLNGIDHALMTVGGWFDAEDLYGPLNIYKTVEQNCPKAYNTIVMGPWSHGDWSREKGFQAVSNVYFGDSISTFFQREIEFDFFNHFLKASGDGKSGLPEAYMFDTGIKEWKKFDVWPPVDIPPVNLYFTEEGKIVFEEPTSTKDFAFEYVSDPSKPVPYTEDIKIVFTPRKYMADDQRFASRRPDVVTLVSDVLEEDKILAGEILAKLKVSTSGTDGDWIVKLIDVYPSDHKEYPHNPPNVTMGGYQQMVRSEMFRGRFRNSFENPEPFVSGEVTDLNIALQDIFHTFKKGHKIMIQIQSTSFPLIDRNPQKYVDNIFEADESDFIKATIKIYGNSSVEIGNQIEQPIELLKK
ncbi:CocE/NonD family hydrolase [Chondrinema litorale]|uniref:CocE/NonD family hydrolase n=1 Tax=Chondrinema litorale TaxID=2994555 RepID=UPI002543F59A|nr:CocE/NonD family hydrolase [Chondrinema litorale]UZR93270.1 CocE/NonD family hydrolase [Chondrinema litorale]